MIRGSSSEATPIMLVIEGRDPHWKFHLIIMKVVTSVTISLMTFPFALTRVKEEEGREIHCQQPSRA